MYNSRVTGNVAGNEGGGIYNLGVVSCTGSTVSGNYASTARSKDCVNASIGTGCFSCREPVVPDLPDDGHDGPPNPP